MSLNDKNLFYLKNIYFIEDWFILWLYRHTDDKNVLSMFSFSDEC